MGKLSDFMARGTVVLSDAVRKMRALQVRFLAGETRDNLEHTEPYGFTSEPHSDAEAFALFFGGERSHGIVFCVADRRYRLRSLEAGEVAIYDDLGQKVHLRRSGIEVVTPANLLAQVGGDTTITVAGMCTVKAQEITFDSPVTKCTGELRVVGKITGTGGMAVSGGSGASVNGSLTTTGDVVAEGVSLTTHTHPGDSGGTTGKPN